MQTTLNCSELTKELMQKEQQSDGLREGLILEAKITLGDGKDSEHNSYLVVAGILGVCHAIEYNK